MGESRSPVAALLDLRALGSQRTLVLVHGNRQVAELPFDVDQSVPIFSGDGNVLLAGDGDNGMTCDVPALIAGAPAEDACEMVPVSPFTGSYGITHDGTVVSGLTDGGIAVHDRDTGETVVIPSQEGERSFSPMLPYYSVGP